MRRASCAVPRRSRSTGPPGCVCRACPAFIVLICLYKFGDSMVATLVGPFMRDAGLSKEMIALMKARVGSVASLAGAALGGWYAFRAGRRRALLVCGLLQTASLLCYVAAALGVGGIGMLWAGSVAEHLFGGMATGGALHPDDGRVPIRSTPARTTRCSPARSSSPWGSPTSPGP